MRAARPVIQAPETVEVRPGWPYRLPRYGGPDGVMRAQDGALRRLIHVEGTGVVVTARQPSRQLVVLSADAENGDGAAEQEGIARMRFALGVDDDLRPFYERFRFDPLIGASVRRRPHLRVTRRPVPFEALAWAIAEQLIEFRRAVGIQRRILRRMGRSCPRTGLTDLPDAETVAGTAPAHFQAAGLTERRACALVRAARDVSARRIDLSGPDHEASWRRLRAIPGIGAWTVEMLALHGQGRLDQVPAGDLSYIKLVGRLRAGGNPYARAEEDEVREFFAPYAPWAGQAAAHMH